MDRRVETLEYSEVPANVRATFQSDGLTQRLILAPTGMAHQLGRAAPLGLLMLVPGLFMLVWPVLRGVRLPPAFHRAVIVYGLVAPAVVTTAVFAVTAWVLGTMRTILEVTPDELRITRSIFNRGYSSRWPRARIVRVRSFAWKVRIETRGWRGGMLARGSLAEARWLAGRLRQMLQLT